MCELPELTKPAILENLKERVDGECRAGRDRVGLCACINLDYVYGNGSLLTGSGTQRSSASIEPSAAGSGAWLAPAVV